MKKISEIWNSETFHDKSSEEQDRLVQQAINQFLDDLTGSKESKEEAFQLFMEQSRYAISSEKERLKKLRATGAVIAELKPIASDRTDEELKQLIFNKLQTTLNEPLTKNRVTTREAERIVERILEELRNQSPPSEAS